jgi:hypothetical protein
MATEPLALAGGLNPRGDAAGAGFGDWRAYHLHYHGDLDRLLAELVRPLLAELLGRGRVDRFYFVRYGLGGPHLRLRLRWTEEPRTREVERAARRFFTRRPSTRSLSDEEVLRRNRPFVRVDPVAGGDGDLVLPDNTFRVEPPLFELDRYGGSERFAESLDLFTLSSGCVLLLLGGGEPLPPGLRLNRAFAVTAALAWGLAEDEADLLRLLAYADDFMGEALAHCAEEAEAVFPRQRDALVALLARALAAAAEPGDPRMWLAEGGRRLAVHVADLPSDQRRHLTASHLHMTVNRIGVINAEEVYAGRLLSLAARELAAGAAWRALWRKRSPQRTAGGEGVAALLPAVFARLAAPAAGPGGAS